MANPEISNIKASFKKGYLENTDLSGNVVGNVFPSNYKITTITTATSLTLKTHMGTEVRVTASDTVITLPVASTTTLGGGVFTIRNMCDNGGGIAILCITGDAVIGVGITTSATLGNTGATHVPGDSVSLAATGSSSWYIVGMTGTWASTS